MLIRDGSGAPAIIEIQATYEPDYLLRVFHAPDDVTEHLARGDDYTQVKKVISINIVYFDLGQGDDYIYRGQSEFYGLHTDHELVLDERQQTFFQRESIARLSPEYYVIKARQFDDVVKNTLDKWIYFLKNDRVSRLRHRQRARSGEKTFPRHVHAEGCICGI